MPSNKFSEYTGEDIQVKKDGHVMMTVDVVKELNRKSFLENKVAELELEIDKCHNALSEIIDSGVQLDEHEETIRAALNMPDPFGK